MSIESDADRVVFLTATDFGVSITYNAATIYGVFDNETVEVDGAVGVPLLKERPQVEVRTSDIPSITQSETFIIAGVSYTVAAWYHDGTGMTRVELEKV